MLTLNGGLLISGGCIDIQSGDLNVTAGVNAGCATFDGGVYIKENGVMQIGNTTLNEAQLSALLRLI